MNSRTTYPDYPELIDQYTETYGTTPGAALYTELEQLYAKAREAADAHTAGRIHSPWGFLQAELRRHDQARHERPQDTDRDREQAIRLTETYIRNAALYIPTEDELTDEIFGDRGRLKPWADDHTLRERMLDHWRAQQPRAKQSIDEAEARAAKFKQHRAAATTTAPPPDPEPAPLTDIPA
jgi:hypothetical protein